MAKFNGSVVSVLVRPVGLESSWHSTKIDSTVENVTPLVDSSLVITDFLDKLEKDDDDDE